jgi:hypothetical protein
MQFSTALLLASSSRTATNSVQSSAEQKCTP